MATVNRAFLLGSIVLQLACGSALPSTESPLGGGGSLAGAGSGGTTGDGPVVVHEAALNLDRSTVNVGTLDIGATGVATVTVTNVGTVTSGDLMVVASAGVTTSGCSGSLGGGASCTLTITATQTAPGTFSGTVSIAAYPGAITPLLVSVIAAENRVYPFRISPPAIDLGDIAVGEILPKQTVTVTAGMDLSDLTVSSSGPDVSIDKAATTCTSTLAPETSCVVVVDFLAADCGSKSDAIVIGAGGPAGKIVTVPITAQAPPPVKLVISPGTRQGFVDGSTITFGVANAGDTPTGLVTAAVQGPYALDFSITNNTCQVLAPLAACTITIAYHSVSVDAGASTIANLVVTDTETCGSSVAVELVDSHYWASALALYPSTTDLFSAMVGTTDSGTVFTVVNSGDPSGALEVGVSRADFLIANDTCSGTMLTKNGSCTFSVAFRPVTAGPIKTGNLTVSDGASTLERTLTGLGVPSVGLAAVPANVDFGKVPVNQVGPAVTITISNGGPAGNGSLSFTNTGNFSVFPVVSTTCSTTLAPGSVCYLDVSFAPTAAQPESATIVVTDGTTTLPLLLTGTGTP